MIDLARSWMLILFRSRFMKHIMSDYIYIMLNRTFLLTRTPTYLPSTIKLWCLFAEISREEWIIYAWILKPLNLSPSHRQQKTFQQRSIINHKGGRRRKRWLRCVKQIRRVDVHQICHTNLQFESGGEAPPPRHETGSVHSLLFLPLR